MAIASSRAQWTKALSYGSSRSIRAKAVAVDSTGDKDRSRNRRNSASIVSKLASVMGGALYHLLWSAP